MILNKEDLKNYIEEDNWYYNKMFSKKDKLLLFLVRDPQYLIKKYKYHLRKEELFLNTPSKSHAIFRLYHLKKKNVLGNKLGILVPPNTFGKGLTIMHHGSIIVNPDARIGDHCILHGNNCIGNNGKTNAVPQIGNKLDLGIGACIIGDVKLGNGIIIGANAVVNKSFNDNSVLLGVPAELKNYYR